MGDDNNEHDGRNDGVHDAHVSEHNHNTDGDAHNHGPEERASGRSLSHAVGSKNGQRDPAHGRLQ